MTSRLAFETSETDYKQCETLALAVIVRGVLDLNSANLTIRQDAEAFFSLDNPMLDYYVSAIAKDFDSTQLAKEIIKFARIGDNSAEAMQQRTVFGNKISQTLSDSTITIAKANTPKTSDQTYSSRELGF